jgi:serine O-acetyltransferase
VTIGVPATGRPGAPNIGNNVYIGNGATLVGKIRICDGAKIAANSLVIDDVPEGASVIGVPARVIIGPARAAAAKAPHPAPSVAARVQAEPEPVHQNHHPLAPSNNP